MTKSKKRIIKVIIAIILSVITEGYLIYKPFSNYFFGDIASSSGNKLIVILRSGIPIVLTYIWIIFMTCTVPMEWRNLKKILRLLSQYLCSFAVLALGCHVLSVSYNLAITDAYEHSHFFLKECLLLLVTVLPITDGSKVGDLLGLKQEPSPKPIWPEVKRIVSKIYSGFYTVWKITFDCFESGEGIGITLMTLAICFIEMELYTGNSFQSIVSYNWLITSYRIFWNLFLYGMIHLFIYALVRNIKWASFIESILFFVYGIINYFVISFRGNPVTLGDFSLIRTALTVVNEYKYTIDLRFILTTVLMIGYLVFLIFYKNKRISNSVEQTSGNQMHDKLGDVHRFVRYLVPLIIVWSFIIVLGVVEVRYNFCYDLINRMGWDTKLQSNYNGYLLSFMADSGKVVIDTPNNYNLKYLDDYMTNLHETFDSETLNYGFDRDQFQLKTGNSSELAKTVEPNIIVIMNESFADLSVLGDFETDVDYMPYIRGLTEDTIYGNLYVSPYGGNTVFSEFEFLTGNSMAMLSTESVPYTQYLNTSIRTPSLVSTLESQMHPYSTVAIHPYSKSGYHRVDVYGSYGFDQFLSVEDFPEYPIYRKFMQDEDNYKKVIELLEDNDDNQPMFIFNITMQNHGGYGERTDYIYQNPVHVTSFSVDSGVDEYLSCIKDSDVAIQGLLEYLAEIDDPTIVLFFGDHQPGLSTEFYDSIYGKSSEQLSYDEVERKFIVPFFIWSNYEDYGGQYIEGISTNYLSALLIQLADLEPTDYQRLLLKLHEEYPVISAISVVDESGMVLPGYSDAAKPLIRKNGNRLSDSRKPQLLLMRRSRLSGVA